MRVAVAVVVALSCQLAHAQAPGMTPLAPPGLAPVTPAAPAPADPPVRSYRAHTLGADAIALAALLMAAKADDKDTLLAISLGTYLGGAPLVHMAKGRNGHALASVTMRIGFPLLGAFVGDALHATPPCDFATDGECYDEGPHDEVVLGMIAGVLAASIVDTAYLANGDPPRTEPPPRWTPSARATAHGLAVGVTGTF